MFIIPIINIYASYLLQLIIHSISKHVLHIVSHNNTLPIPKKLSYCARK